VTTPFDLTPSRGAVLLPMGGTRDKPMVIIPLYGLERSELRDMVQAACGKMGLSEQETKTMADAAEEQFLMRMKVKEASAELRYRIREQAEFKKLRWGGLRPPRKRSRQS
jgi:hypothetical protein